MLDSFLGTCLLLDLETAGRDRVLEIGAVHGRPLAFRGDFRLDQALEALEELTRGARWLLGHNLLGHDLPVLRALAPELRLLRLPVIDTLDLSPLAFPENPYHHLVKGYKLERRSRNDPVADARLAAKLFRDEWQSFAELATREPERLAFFTFCFAGGIGSEAGGPGDHLGMARVLDRIAGTAPLDVASATAWLEKRHGDDVCRSALGELAGELNDTSRRVAWAYVVAWLGVAGGDSVLPSWVRHRHADVARLLRALRDIPCRESGCTWCRETHDPTAQLRRYFGFDSFRPEPAAPDGGSLQESVVRSGLEDRPHLAILATGAGKSICYQLPALARYHRRGSLTVVISPLQALMKDQVDNLNARVGGGHLAVALYGLLTPPERGAVHERVRLGDVALLYVSPEQLRNRSFRRTLAQREVGAWIFDEAHCLSKWGHDFRPDYLDTARYLREHAKSQSIGGEVPPVGAFTATAKDDVQGEILEHFARHVGQELEVFKSRVERDELRFRIESVTLRDKLPRIVELLGASLSGGGAAVVYLASRRRTEKAADYLRQQGLQAAAFHAGLRPAEKRDILEAFTRGELPVVCATNAFGMGIDKEDVRLVVHADIPGSLESYLQEAGRAGRDRLPSDCVLLFDDEDVESQFRLAAMSRLRKPEIAEILRGLRRALRRSPLRSKAGSVDELVLTSGELLRDEDLDVGFASGAPQADTKVKTAIAWLERAGFLERDVNQTRVFQGKPLVSSLDEVDQKLGRLRLSPFERRRWRAILKALLNADPEEGLSADDLAGLPGMQFSPEDEEGTGATAAQRVLRILHAMSEKGLLDQGLRLTAYLTVQGRGGAKTTFDAVCALERGLIDLLVESAPDADFEISEPAAGRGDTVAVGTSQAGEWLPLSLRQINQRLVDLGHAKSHPEILRRLLGSLAEDGRGLAGQKGSLELAPLGRGRYRVRLRRRWATLRELAMRRQALGRVLLGVLLTKIPDGARGKQRVEFSSSDLTAAIRGDLVLVNQIRDPLAAAERGLLFLHEQNVIRLQQGLAVFRQAMTIRLRPDAKGRPYRKRDYAPLDHHYGERTFQVHVMARYAQLGMEAMQGALALVHDYFMLGKASFVERYFPGEEEILERATSQESYQRIVEALGDPNQTRLVTQPTEGNLLILAGPGSGKTRVVVHRCAWLLRVARVPARAILVVCFNRNAALELRRRLRALVGEDARGVVVQTYHGLAMRITGTSFATLRESQEENSGKKGRSTEPSFDRLVPDAVRLLRGDGELPGLEDDALRERLVAGFSHLLVDEYQDIDGDQYEMIAALAGRASGTGETEGRLAILAVGDDDQSIYGFRHASVEYLRRFREDYAAEVAYLTNCYRSTAHILSAAARLIQANGERMKIGREIVVDPARRDAPPGGRWAELEPEGGGRVLVLEVGKAPGASGDGLDGMAAQAAVIADRLVELRRRDPDLEWSSCAVLARKRRALEPVRAVLESRGIPFAWVFGREALPSLWRIREIAEFLRALELERTALRRASELVTLAGELASRRASQAGVDPGDVRNPWDELLEELLEEWREESGDAELSVAEALQFLGDALAEQRREPIFGKGVRLLTVHAAKGLEFPHVLIADGGWALRSGQSVEEERRVAYVAATRARETLTVMAVDGAGNPHVGTLTGPFVERRRPALELPSAEIARRRYELVGLKEIFLDWAGMSAAEHGVHRALEALVPGATLRFVRRGSRGIEIVDGTGTAVAVLSAAGRERWSSRLEGVIEVRLAALVEWRREDTGVEYQGRLRVERWWVPVVEVVVGRATLHSPRTQAP